MTHKPYIRHEEGYRIIQVGAEKGHFIGSYYYDDAEKDNISCKNGNYCELTAYYYLWKHCHDAYIGICHYRRYFSYDWMVKKILESNKAEEILNHYDVIVPIKTKFKTSVKEHYCRVSGFEKDINIVEEIIRKRYPEYLQSFKDVFEGNTSYLYNMIITNKKIFNLYCQWLFDILFELENVIDINEYNDYQKRIFGFLSERLLAVYLLNNKLKVFEIGVLNTEDDRNYIIKRAAGLKRCFLYYLNCIIK